MDDTVRPQECVEHFYIDPRHTAAAGGRPAPPGTRAHLHAQLAALGLAEMGLYAAPAKIVGGDP
eukprot:6179317-Pleurochrysis_carterae.AAC.1